MHPTDTHPTTGKKLGIDPMEDSWGLKHKLGEILGVFPELISVRRRMNRNRVVSLKIMEREFINADTICTLDGLPDLVADILREQLDVHGVEFTYGGYKNGKRRAIPVFDGPPSVFSLYRLWTEGERTTRIGTAEEARDFLDGK